MQASERLTDRARKVLRDAQSEASRLGANSIEPIHVLLAMTRVPACVGAIVLRRLGVDIQGARLEFEAEALQASRSGSRSSGPQPSGALADLLARAGQCADSRNTPWVGTEHLLLAALDASSPCAPTLSGRGIELGNGSAELERYLADGSAPPE